MILFARVIALETYTFILYFVLGALLMLFIYHSIRYLNNKDKAYLFYSLYALFSFLAYIEVAKDGFFKDLSTYFGLNPQTKALFTNFYNGIYFLFFTSFLNLDQFCKKRYKLIVNATCILLAISFLTFLMSNFLG